MFFLWKSFFMPQNSLNVTLHLDWLQVVCDLRKHSRFQTTFLSSLEFKSRKYSAVVLTWISHIVCLKHIKNTHIDIWTTLKLDFHHRCLGQTHSNHWTSQSWKLAVLHIYQKTPENSFSYILIFCLGMPIHSQIVSLVKHVFT